MRTSYALFSLADGEMKVRELVNFLNSEMLS